jgi:phospholipid/cholesterol/gamma-HCH transport system ATP-binding protein
MQSPLIEFKQVTKRFDGRAVLDGIDLSVFQGEVTTIIGKSGVGKSVLLKHIIGLLSPDEGQIWLHGLPIHDLPRREKESRLGRISYMFQNNALFDALTVYENIALPLQYTTRMGKKQIHAKVMERITQTELTEVSRRYPAELSGGMQKRAALARALVVDPEIVLFDEPTTGQDPIRRNAILGMIAEYQRRLGFTAVLISHDLPDVLFISNRVIALYDGKVIFQGPPQAFDEFDHPFRNEFIHSLESLQEELTGLHTGNPVDVLGLEVGRVRGLSIDQQNQKVVVTLQIRNGILIYDDAIASIKTEGLIGDKYVDIDVGGGEPLKPGGTIIETVAPVDIGDLIGKYAFGSVEKK